MAITRAWGVGALVNHRAPLGIFDLKRRFLLQNGKSLRSRHAPLDGRSDQITDLLRIIKDLQAAGLGDGAQGRFHWLRRKIKVGADVLLRRRDDGKCRCIDAHRGEESR
ncbi:hypothetical protein [Sphingobium sp. YBL2]|uniref:hypothetical protein n=1 Tax=Sphingobium sp. (strain YBL2) TaxID=484429 RepID=UPI0005CC3E37|nr:hypothetical protein [Sphingobium sp. YBL2]AJR23353.1 hypothetical protein TZ53_05950 [Sphingobium sp. YBL2]